MTNPREPVNKTPRQNEKQQNQTNIKSARPPKPVKKTPARIARKVQVEVDHEQKRAADRKNNIITISVLAGAVLIVVAVTVYLVGILPMQRTILTVGTENVKTSYFLKRVVAMQGRDPATTEQGLINELTIKQKAAENGVAAVTAQDINDFMRKQAQGTKDSISDDEFNKWFKDQLAFTGLSGSEYREIVSREVQQQRLSDILATKVSDTVPQDHLWMMVFSSETGANAIKTLVDGGADFQTLAADPSKTGLVSGGDQGWLPIDVVNAQLQSAVKTLDVKKCSTPVSVIQTDSSGNMLTRYVLLWISEKVDSMKVTDDQLTVLKNQALSNWETTQQATEKIAFYGLNGATTMDTATTNWLNNKVNKLVAKLHPPKTTPASATTTTTTTSTTSIPSPSTSATTPVSTTTATTAAGTSTTSKAP